MVTATQTPARKPAIVREPMRVAMPIEHIDGPHSSYQINELERDAIRASRCLNCRGEYDPGMPILFVITMQGLLWWHRQHCGTYDI